MQVGQAQIVRSNWYDRSLLTRNFAIVLTDVPHGVTVRQSYTVPANKVAMVAIMPHSIQRESIGAPNSFSQVNLRLTPNGGGVADIAQLTQVLANVDDRLAEGGYGKIMLSAGDKLEARTADFSTGGSVGFTGGFMVTEYAV